MQTLDQSRRSRGAVNNLRLSRHPRPPISGGLKSLRCNLLGLRSRQERLAWVSAYAATLPADAWMLGGDWAMEALPGGVPKAINLDAVCSRPAFLPNQAHLSTWSTRWRLQSNTGFSVMVPLFRNQADRRLSISAPYKLKC